MTTRETINKLCSKLLCCCLCLAGLTTASAQNAPEDHLAVHYNFSDVEGKTVKDATGSGYDATLMNQAKVENLGTVSVLNLGSGTGYMDLGQRIGELVKTLGSFSISVYVYLEPDAPLSGNGYHLWAFSTTTANTATLGQYMSYRLNAQRYAISNAGWEGEKGIELGTPMTKGEWVHCVYVQRITSSSLYVNGERKQYLSTGVPQPKGHFKNAPTVNWLGRAPFTGDAYVTQALVSDFRIYDRALSNAEVAEMAAYRGELDYQMKYGIPGKVTALRTLVNSCKRALSDVSNYPEMAVVELADMTSLCDSIVQEEKASQRYINTLISQLRTAYNRFTATRGFVFERQQWPAEYSLDRGFKHPGALHTDEDFERIRQQIMAKDTRVLQAYNLLCSNEYAQNTTATWPVEVIVRGGSTGQNYMNACRGAAIAYQNALRWKISGDERYAKHGVEVLMQWARVNKVVGGDTNKSLAAGLYGYEFANAAELLRDYEGWKREDFETFKKYIRDVWYPACIDFLRRRNDTWGRGKPGHYWSNWGLCNALAVATFGILLDDVYMYNQGMSFYKHDQVGTFNPAHEPTKYNRGLNEYIGFLVPDVADDARGPYGKLGQMQESGRDQGHALMALGLAVDIAQTGWNQGDDIFALLDNRLAAGIEWTAAYNSGENSLPWTTYAYSSVGNAESNSWVMGGPNDGSRGQFRPYWDRILGHYEGVRGIAMPYSHKMQNNVVDNGGGAYGQTSGGFDHLGFTTLTCTRPAITPAEAPTVIIPKIIMDGIIYQQSDMGGTTGNSWEGDNWFDAQEITGMAKGTKLQLLPTLPDSVADTGQWLWETGETTRTINITANESRVYRVCYTNSRGVKSTQAFSIAVFGDCPADDFSHTVTYDGVTTTDTIITVVRGHDVTFSPISSTRWGAFRWNNGVRTREMTVQNVLSNRTYTVIFTNMGGAETRRNFHVIVKDDPVLTAVKAPMAHGMETGSGVQAQKARGIYDLSGRRLSPTPDALEQLGPGVYIVSDGRQCRKVRR